MSITLGALLCVLTLAYVMLIKPLPYPDQGKLYNVEHQLVNQGDVDGNAFTYPNLMHLYNNSSAFEQSALLYFDADVITSLPSEPMAEISYVTPEYFSLLATKMNIGRPFESTENINTYNPVAIISFDMWQKEFSGSSEILNKKITFSGKSFQVIGVVDQNDIEAPLAGAGFKTKLYIPWDFNSVNERNRKAWGNDDGGLMFLGKLKTTENRQLSVNQLNQQLTTLINDNWQENVAGVAFFKGWSININAIPLKSYLVADGKKSLILLFIGALGLVAIATANIANLFISRTAERQKQLAISAAIGATKKQLFSGIFAETFLIILLTLVVAQCFTYAGFSVLQYFLNDHLPRVNELALNKISMAISLIFFTPIYANFFSPL